jgi:hypothetical protein
MKLDGIGSAHFAELAFEGAAYSFTVWALFAFIILEDFAGHSKV